MALNFDPSKYYPPTSSIPPALFSGREAEFEFLKKRVIGEGKRIGLISGENRVGKTSLAMYFADRFRKTFDVETQYINLEITMQSFPELKKDCKLVIFDDLEARFHPDISARILAIIEQNPGPQYLLIDQTGDDLLKRKIDYELNLKPITSIDSLQILIHELENKIPHFDILNLVELTRGQSEIIDFILRYVKNLSWSYSLAEIENYIFENIIFAGIRDNTGRIILPENPIFQEIKSDIIIVNGHALQKLKMNPQMMHQLKPREFEEMMAELMEKRGYNVDLTKATRDGGKDLIVARHNDFGNFIYYVECKQYRPENPVGVNMVRELMGTVHADKVTAGILITSSYFSPDAISYSKKVEHQISLVDFMRLREWLNNI